MLQRRHKEEKMAGKLKKLEVIKGIKKVNIFELTLKDITEKIDYHLKKYNDANAILIAEKTEIVKLQGAVREITKLSEEAKRNSMTKKKEE